MLFKDANKDLYMKVYNKQNLSKENKVMENEKIRVGDKCRTKP
jgi:hypothetical protein